ncbi:MAG: FAD-dependent oxidoreductase, partial [Acidobacteriota bacterium]
MSSNVGRRDFSIDQIHRASRSRPDRRTLTGWIRGRRSRFHSLRSFQGEIRIPTKKTDDTYDVLIIGGGQAGVPLAHALAKQGKSVALAERKDLGGSCVNFGCTPTKAVIASARVAQLARRGGEFGLMIPRVEVDFPRVLARARGI